MRVLVATTAGMGHFAPLVPFAAAIRDAGHSVRVAAPESFAPVIVQAGFEPIALAEPTPAEIGRAFGRTPELSMEEANRRMLREVFAGVDARAALPGLRATAERWRPNLIVRETMEFASGVLAETFGIPHVQVAMSVASVEAAWLPEVDGPLRALGSARGLAALRAAPRWTLVPERLDDDEPANPHRTFRFRYRPESIRGALPAEWWADADLDLVYVTFGSVAAATGLFPAFYRAALDALTDLPIRVLVTTGDAADPAELGEVPSNVHVERWWPQDQVLPHAAALVGHGGFTTTLAGLAAGVPMVLAPLFSADQYALARRVQAVGAGVNVENGRALPGLLREALERVLAGESFRHAARRVAEEMARLPEPTRCVQMLDDLVAT